MLEFLAGAAAGWLLYKYRKEEEFKEKVDKKARELLEKAKERVEKK